MSISKQLFGRTYKTGPKPEFQYIGIKPPKVDNQELNNTYLKLLAEAFAAKGGRQKEIAKSLGLVEIQAFTERDETGLPFIILKEGDQIVKPMQEVFFNVAGNEVNYNNLSRAELNKLQRIVSSVQTLNNTGVPTIPVLIKTKKLNRNFSKPIDGIITEFDGEKTSGKKNNWNYSIHPGTNPSYDIKIIEEVSDPRVSKLLKYYGDKDNPQAYLILSISYHKSNDHIFEHLDMSFSYNNDLSKIQLHPLKLHQKTNEDVCNYEYDANTGSNGFSQDLNMITFFERISKIAIGNSFGKEDIFDRVARIYQGDIEPAKDDFSHPLIKNAAVAAKQKQHIELFQGIIDFNKQIDVLETIKFIGKNMQYNKMKISEVIQYAK